MPFLIPALPTLRHRLAQFAVMRTAICSALLLSAMANVAGSAETAPDASTDARAEADQAVSYGRDVLPLLRAKCHGCHQPARQMGGVDLTISSGLLGVGDSEVPIVAPGEPDKSELVAQITPDEDGDALMPQQGAPLTSEQIELIREWVAAGATIDVDERAAPRFDAENPPTYQAPPILSTIDVSPDGSLLAVSGVHETLLLDAEAARAGERRIVQRLIGLSERIQSVRFSPEGDQLAVAGGLPGRLGELQIWDVESGELMVSHTATADTLFGVSWSPDGTRVAFGGNDTDLHVVDAETGEQVIQQGAHTDWVLASAFSADGSHLISGSRDTTLKLVETTEGRFVDNITSVSPNIPSGIIYSVARHPTADLVAVADEQGMPRTYRIHRDVRRRIGDDNNLFRLYARMPGRIFAVAFSPDGAHLAAASGDVSTGQVSLMTSPPFEKTPEEIQAIQGKTVDQRSADEKQQLDDFHRQGAELIATTELPTSLFAVRYDPDGKTLYTGGADGLLRVLDANSAALLAEFVPAPLPDPTSDGVTSSISPLAKETATSVAAPLFLTDVMPVLAKLGCNAGTCHGAASGQNGFKLSLRGYDPLGDYRSLTEDLAGRRTNRTQPEQSLMVLKAVGAIPHGGGAVVEKGSRRYQTLVDWIAAGAQYDATAPRVVELEMAPLNPVVQNIGDQVALRAEALYSDGTRRDVTEDAFIESGDTERATVDQAGMATAVRRGEAALLARYEGSYASTTLTVMGDRDGFEWRQQPVFNPVDELVDAKLRRMKIAASDVCSDEVFVRRLYLDLTGLPPSADQLQQFSTDSRESRAKRSAKIDELIGGEPFIEHWTNYWSDLLLVNGQFLGREGATAYRDWIRSAVAENQPYDQFVRKLMTASGSNRENPPASYFKVLQTPDALMETTTHVFLGVRFNCNKCHDHPFERWTQDQYYGLAAFFAKVKLEKDPESGDRTIAGTAVEQARPLFEIVGDEGDGEVLHLRTSAAASPQFPYDHPFDADDSDTLREQIAEWLVAPENRYFAASHVNRIWAKLTGVGLIEPVDDIRAGNPPSNPELLDWLTRQFIDSRFDTRELIRTICNSRTYQLSLETSPFNADDQRNYSHASARRLPAETLFDSVYHAVGAETRLPGVPPGTRAAALPDGTIDLETGLLSTLGKPARETGCVCERSNDLQLGPILSLVNGPSFAKAIADPENALAKLEAELTDDRDLAEAVFLRILARRPTERELTESVDLFGRPVSDRDDMVAAREHREAELREGYEPWLSENRPVDWHIMHPLQMSSTMGAELTAEKDGSILSTGETGKGVYRIEGETSLESLSGLRLEALADDRLPSLGPGRAENGNFVVSKIRVLAAPLNNPDKLKAVKLRTAEADYSQEGYDVSGAIDANDESGWAASGALGKDHAAAFGFSRARRLAGGARVVVEIDQQYSDSKHLLGRFRFALTGASPPLLRTTVKGEIADLLRLEDRELTDEQRQRIYAYYLATDLEYRDLDEGVRLLQDARLAAVQDLAWALINSPAFLFNH